MVIFHKTDHFVKNKERGRRKRVRGDRNGNNKHHNRMSEMSDDG